MGGGGGGPAQLNWVLLRVCNEQSTEDEFKNSSAVLFTKVIQNPNIIQTESWYDQTWLGMNRLDSQTAGYNTNTWQETIATWFNFNSMVDDQIHHSTWMGTNSK